MGKGGPRFQPLKNGNRGTTKLLFECPKRAKKGVERRATKFQKLPAEVDHFKKRKSKPQGN